MLVTVTMNPSVDRTVALEELALGETNRVKDVRTDASGKGINVSLALRQLGFPSIAAGFLAGREGRFVEAEVREFGITPHFTWLKKGSTRVNIKVYEVGHNRTTEINEPGPVVEPQDEAAIWRDLAQVIPQAEYVICSGSLPPGVKPDFYSRLIDKCRELGVKVCLDASGPALLEGIKAKPFLIKPNEDEVEQLLGWKPEGKEEIRAAAASLTKLGMEMVIMSLGADGAVFYREGEEVLWGRAAADPVRSTSGCGDALLAGVVSSLLTRRTWDETVRWSIATATATAEIFGTGFPTVEHIKQVLPRVVVESL
ncbi:MAG TPA: 1-phosphofructokinase [Firmicutes bacterium]|nr:MAG: hypothetical protein AA931_06070 [Peptococcaceae bacterium 1109]HHT72247.1 1-phosphofructokinase [Bacillota bacterium]